jgi:tRNA pseudouridine55 synthase
MGFEGWGFTNLDKPLGWTSHDCIGKLRRLLRMRKIGHGGTLDPMATGVLPIAVGRATRLLQYLPKQKAYRATVRFGMITATDDLEGEILTQQACPELDLETITAVLPTFVGKISQIPPAFSAIQRNGKRLYELARQGIAVDVPSREVEIFGIEVLAWRSGDFPELELLIRCGEGTYIRAIARDLGAQVGTGATLAGLIRTSSGGFDLSESLSIEAIAEQLEQNTFSCYPPEKILQHLPRLSLTPDQANRWNMGQKIIWEMPDFPQQTPLCLYDETDRCLGIGEFHPAKEDSTQILLAPRLVLYGK